MNREATDAPPKRPPTGEVSGPLRLVAAAVVLGCAYTLLSAVYVYPLPGTDANAFIPTAVRYAAGAGLDNPIYVFAYATDVEAQGRFCFHGPLFPWLVGLLMPAATTKWALVVIALLRIAAITWLGFLLVGLVKKAGARLSYTAALVVSLLVLGYAGMTLPTVGRPEALASILVILGITIFIRTRDIGESVLQGLVLGLLGATHPAGAVLAVAFYGTACAVRYRFPVALRQTVTAGSLGVLLCLALISVSPNGLMDTLAGIRSHAALQITRYLPGVLLIIKYWVFWPDRFFFGPIFLLGILLFLFKSTRGYQDLGSPVLFSIGICVTALTIYFFGIKSPETSYNISLFQPIAYGLLIQLLFDARSEGIWNKKGTRLLVCGMALVSLASPVRTLLMFQNMIATGKTYDAAKTLLEKSVGDDSFVIFHPSNWVLSEDYEHMWVWNQDWEVTHAEAKRLKPSFASSTRIFFVQSERARFTGLAEDASLILEWRSFEEPEIFGIPLARNPTGYGFALWALDPQPAGRPAACPQNTSSHTLHNRPSFSQSQVNRACAKQR